MTNLRVPRHLAAPGQGSLGHNLQSVGFMACFVIERHEVPRMIYASDGGDFTAAQIRIGLGNWAMRAFGPNRPPQICAACDHSFTRAVDPEAFFLAIPQRGDGDSIVCGICRACARRIGSDGLLAACATHFRKLYTNSVITGIAGAR